MNLMNRLQMRRCQIRKKGWVPQALQILGLAQRAGAVVPGTAATRRSIQKGDARVVLVARDASSAQRAKIKKTMRKRTIPEMSLGDRATLGAAIGRAPITALAVTDASLAGLLLASTKVDALLDEGRG